MTLNEYLEKNGNKEIEVLKDGSLRVVEPEHHNGLFNPAYNQDYFGIKSYGVIGEYGNTHQEITDTSRAIANCFKTKEEAEQALERLKIRAELLEAGGIETQNILKTFEKTEGFFGLSLDGENTTSPIVINYNLISDYWLVPFDIVFKSREEAEKAVEQIGEERIKKYLFGVES